MCSRLSLPLTLWRMIEHPYIPHSTPVHPALYTRASGLIPYRLYLLQLNLPNFSLQTQIPFPPPPNHSPTMAARLVLHHVTRLCLRGVARRLVAVRPLLLIPATPRSPSRPFATFSGKTPHEIDLITLRRRVDRLDLDHPDLDALFRTTLDASASLNGLYDPSLVEDALVSISMRSGPESVSGSQSRSLSMTEFVTRFNVELATLTDFIRTSYSIRRISQLNPVETSNVLFIFKDLYSKGKLLAIDPNNLSSYDDMVASFWSLLEHSEDRARVPRMVGSLLDSSKLTYVDLYSLGIGNFLSELRVLATEFDFSTLSTVDPVVSKISALVLEFSKYLQEHDASHDYDLEFFRVVIYVLRYKKLQDILVAVGQKNISPRDLLALTNDPDAAAIQKALGDRSGEPQKLENLFFVQHRNFFNVIYTAVGFSLFDTIFAALYLEAQKNVYSADEKAQIDNFLETFLPLVCGGLVLLDALQDVKYSCLPVRYDGRVLAPFKISDNVCENYDFSLAMLFDVPSRLYLIRAASSYLKKPLEVSSIEEISEAISATTNSGLLREEGEKLVASLKEMLPYSINSFRILDRLSSQANLLRAANNNVSHFAYAMNVTPDAIDLTAIVTTVPEKAALSLSSIRVNNLELSDFKNELADFKSKDLCDIPYAELGDRNILRLLTSRVSDVLSSNNSKNDSAVNPDNVAGYATILELLCATFDINGGETIMLDKLVENLKPVSDKTTFEPTTEYFQIPDYLRIHDFWVELEILRADELKTSFKDATPEQILGLMKDRFTEFNNGLPNSNPTSRMNPSNLNRFMKLAGRLEQLFYENNGHTEVLDVVLKSQSEIQKLDAKLEAQRRQREEIEAAKPETKSLYAPGAYLQIPEEMQLHEFVKELEIFRHDDLRSSFKNFPAEKILGLMQKRIKEIYSDLPCTNQALRMSKANLVAFIKLHAKLEKLLAWNGGNTEILDTVIHSQSVFNDFEDQLARKKQDVSKLSETPATTESLKSSESTIYRPVTDDMMFEEFAEELLAIKQTLGKSFKSSTSEEVLGALHGLREAEENADMKSIYGKLARNLMILFKHNNNQTFILDNVLLNAEAFKTFEKKLANASAAENKFDMSEFLDEETDTRVPFDYHREDYVLSLLNSNTTPADLDLETEASIKEAVTSALSKAENRLLEEDPEEYAAINNLTAQKIRDSYIKPKKSDKSGVKRLDKESLEKFLKSTKVESDKRADLKWREKQAYEWSSNMANHQRSLETGNFFDSLLSRGKSKEFPMFPTSANKEYLVLTTSGPTFMSKENPLGSSHVAEDILATLDKFDEGELEKFSRHVKKLQRKHWKLIGGGANDRMLVLSRTKVGRKKKFLTKIKTALASTGVVFLALIGLNIWLDDEHPDRVTRQLPPAPSQAEEPAQAVVVESEPKVESSLLTRAPTKSLWQRLMWKD